MFLGRTFACPDCSAMLLIEPHGHDGVSARVTTAAISEPHHGLKPSTSAKPKVIEQQATPTLTASTRPNFGVHLQPRASVMDTLSRRPALLGWSVAILFAIVLFAVINSSNKPPVQEIAPVAKANPKLKAQLAEDAQADRNLAAKPVDPELMIADEHVDGANQTPDKQPQPIETTKPENITATAKPDADLKRADGAAPKPGDDPTLPANQPDAPKPVANNLPPEPPPVPVPEVPKNETVETIEARLKQKLARFDQAKPVPFVKLLDVLEDLAGVSIVWDLETVDDKQLQKTVTLKLQQTTVGEILDALLKQVGLSRHIADGRIELSPIVKQEK